MFLAIFIALTSYTSIPPTIIVEGVYPITPILYTAEEVEEIVAEVIEKVDIESDLCLCMRTARNLGANLPFVDAKDLKRNSTPTIGGVVIFQYGEVYHVAYIAYIFPGDLYVKEGNYIKDCTYSERFVSWKDSAIIGFYHEI